MRLFYVCEPVNLPFYDAFQGSYPVNSRKFGLFTQSGELLGRAWLHAIAPNAPKALMKLCASQPGKMLSE